MNAGEAKSEQAWSLRSIIGCGVIQVAVCLSVAFLDSGKIGVEKTLTILAMPVGLLWLLLGAACFSAVLKRQAIAWGLGIVLVCFSLVSCPPVIDLLVGMTERSVSEYVPTAEAEPLDVVVVLGGGTSLGPHRPEVTGAGDRVVYAAELYQLGFAKRLITTGKSISNRGQEEGRIGPAAETIEIWKKLGISEEAIVTLSGRTTFEEMIQLKDWLSEQPDGEQLRVGLLTSALHLPRALRLAKARGLEELIPLAANHRANANEYLAIDFLPRASALSQFADLQKEWMARLVGR